MKPWLFLVVFSLGIPVATSGQNDTANRDRELTVQKALVEKALEEEADSNRIARELIRLGELYNYRDLYTEAISEFRRANGYLMLNSGDSLRAAIAIGAARVHIAMGNYKIATEGLETFLSAHIRDLHPEVLARFYGLLGVCAEKRGNYLLALEHQKQSLELYRKHGSREGIAETEEHLGSIYEDLGQLDLAYEHFDRAYTHFSGTQKKETAHLLNNLGDVRRKQGRYDEAMELTLASLALAVKLGDYHQLESAHKDLAKTYAATGDFQKAYEHLRQAGQFADEFHNGRNTAQLNALRARFESDRKTFENQALKTENLILDNQRKVLAGILLTLVLASLVAGWLMRRRRRQKEKEQQVRLEELLQQRRRHQTTIGELEKELELKTSALSRFSLNLSHKNKMLSDVSKSLNQLASRSQIDPRGKLNEMVHEIDQSMGADAGWDTFMNIFEEIHPEFMRKLNARAHEALSPSELRLAMLLRMNLSSKEIASILRVTPDSVRVARHRLRKKLPIGHKKELVNFMVSL